MGSQHDDQTRLVISAVKAVVVSYVLLAPLSIFCFQDLNAKLDLTSGELVFLNLFYVALLPHFLLVMSIAKPLIVLGIVAIIALAVLVASKLKQESVRVGLMALVFLGIEVLFRERFFDLLFGA